MAKYVRGEGGILVLTDGSEVVMATPERRDLLARLAVPSGRVLVLCPGHFSNLKFSFSISN
ncbi:MAG: hypothetical protein H6569_10500 [Lewinellaceae bacterium]|nr:hypothetical protein [Lewinellaceae bacterium]